MPYWGIENRAAWVRHNFVLRPQALRIILLLHLYDADTVDRWLGAFCEKQIKK